MKTKTENIFVIVCIYYLFLIVAVIWKAEDCRHAAQQSRALDAASVCRVINHFYVEGVCSQCGSKEPPRQ